jgi:hypothetical protein
MNHLRIQSIRIAIQNHIHTPATSSRNDGMLKTTIDTHDTRHSVELRFFVVLDYSALVSIVVVVVAFLYRYLITIVLFGTHHSNLNSVGHSQKQERSRFAISTTIEVRTNKDIRCSNMRRIIRTIIQAETYITFGFDRSPSKATRLSTRKEIMMLRV